MLHSGLWETPYYPSSVYDASGTDPSERSVKQQRPDCGSTSGYLPNPTTSAFFNVSAYSIPAHPVDAAGTAEPIGRFGNCGVGILEGPGAATFSMSTGKTFHLPNASVFRYEAQFSNLFNILNWGEPNMNITGSFGQITNAQRWRRLDLVLSRWRCASSSSAVGKNPSHGRSASIQRGTAHDRSSPSDAARSRCSL